MKKFRKLNIFRCFDEDALNFQNVNLKHLALTK